MAGVTGEIPYLDSHRDLRSPHTRTTPIPDYFYLMLWVAAGGNSSWIPAYHPELVRIANMANKDLFYIHQKGEQDMKEYRTSTERSLAPPESGSIDIVSTHRVATGTYCDRLCVHVAGIQLLI